MWHFLLSVDGSYLCVGEGDRLRGGGRGREGEVTCLGYALQTWTQPSVYAEYPSVHNSTQCEVVEDLTTPSPNVAAPVFSLALVIEAVHLGDLSRLVISADERHSFGVADFEGE